MARARFVWPLLLGLRICDLSVLGQDAPPPTRDWPQWRGPNNNGSAVEPTQPMVDSILKRPIVWVSEDRQPLFYGYQMSANSGCGAPFAADGRLFFFYRAASERMQFPVSEAEQKRAADSFRVNGAGDLRNARAVEVITRETWVKWNTNIAADEVVVSMDMATGRTLWRTALPIRLEQTGGRFIQCAGAAYGRVYVQSLRDICFACLDAETGEVLWMDLNDRELIAGERSLACQIRQHKNGAAPGTGAVSAIAAADGVVISTLGTYDALTGQRLRDGYSQPYRWTHHGKEYLVLGNKCVEPRTGKLAWQLDGTPGGLGSGATGPPAFTDDFMVVGGFTRQDGTRDGVSCFQISPTGCKRLWSLPAKGAVKGYTSFGGGCVVHQGHVYFWNGSCPQPGTVLVCVELTTGRIVGELPVTRGLAPDVGGSVGDYCPAFAMGDRLFLRAERGCFLVYQAASPNRPFRFLERDLSDCFAFGPLGAAVDGRVYVRGIGWIECWDLRANPKAPSDSLKTWSPDPAVAKCEGSVAGLGSPFMNERNAAVKAVTQLPASNVKAVAPTIAQLIQTGKYTTVQAASAALVALGEKAADAAPALTEVARGAVEGGRDQRAGLAWQALAAVDRKTALKESIPYLKRQDEQTLVALRALRLAPKLSVLCLEDLGRVLAIASLTDVAAEAIAEADPKAATVVLPSVVTALERRGWKLTRPLALALIRVAPVAEKPELAAVNDALTRVLTTKWMKKSDKGVKEDTQFFDMACDIITVMGRKAVGTVPVLVERLPKGSVSGALSAIGPKAIPALEARLGREKNDKVKGDIQRILDECRNKKADEKNTDEKDDK